MQVHLISFFRINNRHVRKFTLHDNQARHSGQANSFSKILSHLVKMQIREFSFYGNEAIVARKSLK